MQEQTILQEQVGSVKIITLNIPGLMNALNVVNAKELRSIWQEISEDDSVRAVILTGAGRAFCSGANLADPGGGQDVSSSVKIRLVTQVFGSMIEALATLEKPVVGAINGVAAGGGCNLALACDLLLAAEDASFIQIFVRRGLVVDAGGTFFMPRLVGMQRAKQIMYLGEEVDARKALELGLVVDVVPGERLMEEAMGLAERLAAGPTRAIGMIKNALNQSLCSDLRTSLELEAAFQGIAMSTGDVMEGMAAFFQKRQPEFKGR